MANSEHVDLMSIGHHCAVEHCGQVDFLPFKCDCCDKTFCLEHRTYESHNCPKAGCKQTEVIVCPLCAQGIMLLPGQDPNVAFEMHQRRGCDTRNYERVHRKKTCPVAGCKEKLTTVNSYTCKQCGTEICLKHRLPSDHKCHEILAARKHSVRHVWTRNPAPSASSSRVANPRPSSHAGGKHGLSAMWRSVFGGKPTRRTH